MEFLLTSELGKPSKQKEEEKSIEFFIQMLADWLGLKLSSCYI
jgi:hypothetical protein